MALAASLLPGFQYEVTAGPLEGEVVTIIDNTPFKDGDELGRQRKITVRDPLGGEQYMLPRLLSDKPVGMTTEQMTPVAYAESAVVNLNDPIIATTPLEILEVISPSKGGIRQAPITDPMDSRLDSFRPNKVKARKKYITRTMSNGQTDIDFLLTFTNDYYRSENDGYPCNIMLKGDTQSGKTMLVERLAVEWSDKMAAEQEARGEVVTYTKPMPIFTLSGSSGVTDYDLFGQPASFVHPETGAEHLVHLPGLAELAAQAGGIFYLDEVNAMLKTVTSSIHPMTDGRHSFINRGKPVMKGGVIMPEVVKVHFDCWVFATFNEGYQGMGDLNEAFINRFRTIRWGYDKEVEGKLITSPAIRLLGEFLRTARKKRSIRTPVGTAALQQVERDVETFGPVLGLEVLTGMFKENEVEIVEEIIKSRSIILMLNEEQRQKRLEEAKG